jgi:hypothetical protein
MRNLLLVLLLVSVCPKSFGQSIGDTYITCLNKFLEYKRNTDSIIKLRTGFGSTNDTIFLKKGNFFTSNSLDKKIKLLSEQDIDNRAEGGNIFNLIEIRPIIFEKDSMYIHIRDTDISKGINGSFYMLKGGGVYKIWFNCITNKLEITTISESI